MTLNRKKRLQGSGDILPRCPHQTSRRQCLLWLQLNLSLDIFLGKRGLPHLQLHSVPKGSPYPWQGRQRLVPLPQSGTTLKGYPSRNETYGHKKTYSRMSALALFRTALERKPNPSEENEQWISHTKNCTSYSAIKSNKLLTYPMSRTILKPSS